MYSIDITKIKKMVEKNGPKILIVFLCASLITILSPQIASGISIDLNTWVQEGPMENGNWVVDETGTKVTQTVNQYPTMFVSPRGENLIDGTIEGKIIVNDADDDWIGFVLGFGESTNNEFIILDWKSQEQDGSLPGFTLARVESGNHENLFVISGDPGDILFYNHQEGKDGWEIIATNNNVGGWQPGIEYEFKIDYFRDHVTVQVAGGEFGTGQIVLEASGNFPAGRIGFYNHSQQSVTYSAFEEDLHTETLSPETVVAVGIGGTAAVGAGIVTIMKMGIFSTKTAIITSSNATPSAISSLLSQTSPASSSTSSSSYNSQSGKESDFAEGSDISIEIEVSGGIERVG